MSNSAFSLCSRELAKEYPLRIPAQATPLKLRVHLQWGWGKLEGFRKNRDNWRSIGNLKLFLGELVIMQDK